MARLLKKADGAFDEYAKKVCKSGFGHPGVVRRRPKVLKTNLDKRHAFGWQYAEIIDKWPELPDGPGQKKTRRGFYEKIIRSCQTAIEGVKKEAQAQTAAFCGSPRERLDLIRTIRGEISLVTEKVQEMVRKLEDIDEMQDSRRRNPEIANTLGIPGVQHIVKVRSSARHPAIHQVAAPPTQMRKPPLRAQTTSAMDDTHLAVAKLRPDFLPYHKPTVKVTDGRSRSPESDESSESEDFKSPTDSEDSESESESSEYATPRATITTFL